MSFFTRQFGEPPAKSADAEPEYDVSNEEYEQFVAVQRAAELARVEEEAAAAGTAVPTGAKRARATNSTAVESSSRSHTRAVPPPLFEFNKETLGGRELPADIGWLRVTFENAKTLGDVLSRLRPLNAIIPLSFTRDGMNVCFIDTSHVTYIKVLVPRNAFIAFDNVIATDTTIHIHSSAFQERKSQFTAHDTVTFGFQEVAGEANTLFVTLYPRTGDKKDGIVNRFTVQPVNEEVYDHDLAAPDQEYQHEITIGYATILDVLTRFKACEKVVYAITADSLDVGGKSDDKTSQMVQISFVETADNEPRTVEAAIKGRVCCHYNNLRPITPKEPAKVINFQIAFMYMKRTLLLFSGCRFIRMRFGRGYAKNDGEFLPLAMYGTYYSEVDGRPTCCVATYIANQLEVDN